MEVSSVHIQFSNLYLSPSILCNCTPPISMENSRQPGLEESTTQAQECGNHGSQDAMLGLNATTTVPETPNPDTQHNFHCMPAPCLTRTILNRQIAMASVPQSALPVVGTPLAGQAVQVHKSLSNLSHAVETHVSLALYPHIPHHPIIIPLPSPIHRSS